MSGDRDLTLRVASRYEITDFHYDLVRKVSVVNIMFLSDQSQFSDFNGPEHRPGDRNYWLGRIYHKYGVDLHDVQDNSLNIAVLGSELERRLKGTLPEYKKPLVGFEPTACSFFLTGFSHQF